MGCGNVETEEIKPFVFEEKVLDVSDFDLKEKDFSHVSYQEVNPAKYECYRIIKKYAEEHIASFEESCRNITCKRGALCYNGICYKLNCME